MVDDNVGNTFDRPEAGRLPLSLALLPLRDTVLFPQSILPLAAGRAASLLNRLPETSGNPFESALGMSPSTLAEYAEAAARNRAVLEEAPSGQPQPVFSFVLGPRTNV